MRQHLELVSGTSAKFWEVSVDGKTMTVRFGRLGTNGQTKPKQFASPALATAAANKLVASKQRKGYTAGKPHEAVVKRGAAKKGTGAIEKLVVQLDALTRRYRRGEGKDPDDEDEYQLFGPPSRAQLAAHLKLWPDLPPSYVEFLTAHAGWRGFWGGTSLLGPRTPRNTHQWRTVLEDVAAMDGYLDADDDPADPDYVRSRDVIVFAFNDNGGLLAFDRRKPGPNGELWVVDCMRTNGCVDNRHRNFAAFLRSRIACTKGWIADQ